jgi:hypothetical protein
LQRLILLRVLLSKASSGLGVDMISLSSALVVVDLCSCWSVLRVIRKCQKQLGRHEGSSAGCHYRVCLVDSSPSRLTGIRKGLSTAHS